MADVFVSYKAEDRRRIRPLVQCLQADGYSVFGNVALGGNGINLFARYDSAKTSKDIDPSLKNTYYNVGVEFPVIKELKIAPVYKYTRLENDTGVDQVTKELGMWGEFRF